jgi:peptide/nickel transport system substrate-binding protein
VSCRPAAQPTSAPSELHISVTGDPKSLDPIQVIEDSSDTIRYLTAGVPLRINRATDALEPELAESWNLSTDSRSITIHMRAGLKFSDNTPLNANDVARSLNRALDPKEASPIGDTFASDAGKPVVTVTSPLDLSIAYSAPKPGLDRLLDTLPVVPATVGKLPATAGPYYIAEYKPGQYLRLARNPNYWKRDQAGKPLPRIDSIRVDIQANHDLEVERFLRGDEHIIAKLDPLSFDRVDKAMPGAARDLGPSLDSESMWFNESPAHTLPEYKRKWFRSAAFRHAVSRAINRDDIARVVYGGRAHASRGPVSPGSKFWFNTSLGPLPYDPDGAAKLLAGDGFVLRDGVLHDATGHPVEFSLITNAGNAAREHIAPLIQTDLAKLGIKLNIVPLDFNSLVDRIAKTFDYELAMLSINVELDPIEVINVWMSSGDHHAWWIGEKTPATPWEARIDELERIQSSSGSRDARKKAFDEVQQIAVDQEPIIYLVNPDHLSAISPHVKGAQPTAVPPQIWWNMEWLSLE